MSYLSFHRLYFDFPGFLTFLENGRRRRGWITFTIRCFYRRYVKSVFVLSLHFFSCFLVWFVITIMWRLYLLSSSNRDQNWEKERPRYKCESFTSLKYSKAESRFPSALPLICIFSVSAVNCMCARSAYIIFRIQFERSTLHHCLQLCVFNQAYLMSDDLSWP